MNGWLIFLIISLVLGVIVSNLLLLRDSAKNKIPEHILKSIAEKKIAEELEVGKKKPTDD